MPSEPADITAARELLNVLSGVEPPDNSPRNRAEADLKFRQNHPTLRIPPQPAPESRNPVMLSESLSRQLQQLELAKHAPRCQHIKTNGVRCGSPALKHKNFCHFHHQLRIPRRRGFLPALEDANGIQCAIMQVAEDVMHKRIDRLTANTLLYALQTAAINLKHVRFEPGIAKLIASDSRL